jgi:DNA-binding response OmpR family regulator
MSQSDSAVVLLVDDDEMTRELMRTVLQRAGYSIVEASSGKQALKLVEAQPPHLVLLDVRLGDMSGYDVCTQIKHGAATQAVPVIILTAHENENERQYAQEAGADAFISRMQGWQAVVSVVQQLLS